MSPKTGRPTANKKTERLEIRLTPQEAQDLQYCADVLGISRTDVINKGVQLVKEEVAKNSEGAKIRFIHISLPFFS